MQHTTSDAADVGGVTQEMYVKRLEEYASMLEKSIKLHEKRAREETAGAGELDNKRAREDSEERDREGGGDPLVGITEANCEKLAKVLQKNRTNPEVLAPGLKMIGDFGYMEWRRNGNKGEMKTMQRIAEAPGALELVVDVLRAFGKTHEGVAQQGCWAVACLALDGNKKKLGELGACEAVVAVLSAFGKTHDRVAEYGCWAAANLIWYPKNTERMRELGACEVVVDVLKAFGKTYDMVAEYGCSAVAALAEDNLASTKKLGDIGACEAVVAALWRECKALFPLVPRCSFYPLMGRDHYYEHIESCAPVDYRYIRFDRHPPHTQDAQSTKNYS